MDEADKAKILETQTRQKGIAQVTQKLKQKGTQKCIDCESEIPHARRQAYPAATRCIACQEIVERGKR